MERPDLEQEFVPGDESWSSWAKRTLTARTQYALSLEQKLERFTKRLESLQNDAVALLEESDTMTEVRAILNVRLDLIQELRGELEE